MRRTFLLLHILLLTLLAYLGAGLLYAPFDTGTDSRHLPSGPASPVPLQPDQDPKTTPDVEKHRVIIARNLFHVLASAPATPGHQPPESPEIDSLKPTRLKLALWGTVTGSKKSPDWAVIEDRKEKSQALYAVGDTVAGATIKKIMRNKIILTYQNQDQILEVDPSLAPPRKAVSPPIQSPATLFRDPVASAGHLPGTSLNLMKQVRIRPFFRQGDPQGMLLYGIKPDSPFQKMGLKNGDIVQEINGTQTLNATDAKAVYQSAASRDETRMILLRRGKKIQLVYNPSDNTYTTEAVTND